ncbi:glycosyltransferase family 87 protein [Pseudobutyrivibrio sp.]|uniref:glycosyltransferase family 87 protein n=1 Tax=Pseudobutyrivibrio sp. TaxID=2014367 RepID=UPI0025CD53CE|nr:glycosyltransferase family 87 protein [Pseudobutyrivibrio sp.]MBR5648277.1 DUF2029 domain-containing protein [Pseudobutyrivibrio sp.]
MKTKVIYEELKELLHMVVSNWKIVVLGVIVAAIILLEWIFAGTFSYGKTDILVEDYKDSSSFFSTGYIVDGNEYYRNNSNAYISLPLNDHVNSLELSVDNMGNDHLALKVYYSNVGSGKNYSYKYIRDVDGNIKVKLPGDTCRVKLKFERNLEKTIKIESIKLYNSATCLNIKLLCFACLFGILFTAVIVLVLLLIKRRFSHNITQKFILVLLLGEFIFFAVNFLTNGYYWGTYFFPNSVDCFMDHFNMLALLNNPDPYYLKASYPAMCFLLLRIVHIYLPIDIQAIEPGLVLRENSIAMFVFCVIVVVALYLLAIMFGKALGNENSKLNVLILLLSGPVLFTLQRGNILLIAFIFLLYYCLHYDSDDKKKRYLAYFALAFAASIKVYPALFGLLTLKKKRYKETIHLAIIGFLMFILPFFAFDGFNTVKEFLDGLSAAGTVMTRQGVGQNLSLENLRLMINLIMGVKIPSSGVLLAIITVILLVTAYFSKKEWETLFLLAAACAWYPAFSFTYVLVLFYPAIFAALKDSESIAKKDLASLCLMVMPLCLPYMKWVDKYIDQTKLEMPLSFSSILLYFIVISMVIRIIAGVIIQKISREEKILFKADIVINIAMLCCIAIIYGGYTNKTYSTKYHFEGKGTEKSPYEISSVEDFQYLVKATNAGESFSGAFFVQTKDIEFDGLTSVDPVGWSERDAKFSGVYDGNGYSLSNYYSMSDHDEDMGLFGVLDGEVINLNLHNCNIAGEYAGALAYKVTENGLISNCYVNGQLLGYCTGSLAVYNYGIIENSAAFVNSKSNISYDIANCKDTGIIINSYDSNSPLKHKLDDNSLEKMNTHVDVNNSNLLSERKMCYWIFDPNYFVSVTNE